MRNGGHSVTHAMFLLKDVFYGKGKKKIKQKMVKTYSDVIEQTNTIISDSATSEIMCFLFLIWWTRLVVLIWEEENGP